MTAQPDAAPRVPWTRKFPVVLAVFTLAYFAGLCLDNFLRFGPEHLPSVHTETALLFAMLTLFPFKRWQMLAAAAVASFAFEGSLGHCEWWSAISESVGSFLSAAVATLLMRRVAGKDWTFANTGHVLTFCGVSLLVPALFGMVLWPIPRLQVADLGHYGSWQLWWLSDAIGMLMIAPMILTWVCPIRRGRWEPQGSKLELFMLAAFVLLVGDFVFGEVLQSFLSTPSRFTYVLFIPMLWASLRFGTRGAATVVAAIALIGLFYLRDSLGPFDDGSTVHRLLLTQALFACVLIFTLIPGAVIAERENVSRLLREAGSLREAILDGAHMSMIALDQDGVIRSVNATTERWLGWKSREMVRKFIPENWHDPEHLQAMYERWSARTGLQIESGVELYRAIAADPNPREHEMLLARRDGSTLWVAQSVTALQSSSGNNGYVVISRDISWRKQTESALRETESAVQSFFDAAPMMMGIVEIRPNGPVFVSANKATAESLATTPMELVGMPLLHTGIPGEITRAIADWCAESQRARMPIRRELGVGTGTARRGFVITVSYIATRESGHSRFCYIMEDVTRQRHTQEELERFATILEATTDLVIYSDKLGHPMYINRACRKLFGLPPDVNVSALSLADFHPEWAYEVVRREGIPVAMLEGAWNGETAVRDPSGQEIPVSQVILAHRSLDGVEFLSTIMRDISDRKQTEERVRESLKEKEALLKEIHHRVKNNMQVVSSLLGLQASHTNDPVVRAMFAESRERINTMAVIHERLYQSGNLGSIDFGDFIRSVVPMIFAAQNVRTSQLRAEVQADPVRIGIDTAIPLGLLVNELISNCLKHAFVDQTAGQITVTLVNLADGTVQLTVRDNGVGLPEDFETRPTSSLGLRLVKILSGQIGAQVKVASDSGTVTTVTFRPPAEETGPAIDPASLQSLPNRS